MTCKECVHYCVCIYDIELGYGHDGLKKHKDMEKRCKYCTGRQNSKEDFIKLWFRAGKELPHDCNGGINLNHVLDFLLENGAVVLGE